MRLPGLVLSSAFLAALPASFTRWPAPSHAATHDARETPALLSKRPLALGQGFEKPTRVAYGKATVELGSRADELADVAASCNRESGATTCHPENFALEIWREPRQHVPAFRLDVHEVSLGSYLRCVRAGHCSGPGLPPLGNGEDDLRTLPVVGVTRADAERHCSFVGARLPREDELERAARGLKRRRYPWGDSFHAGRVNGGQAGPERTSGADGYDALAPVEAFADGRTPEGFLQLAGNVEEWTADGSGPDAAPLGFAAARGGHFADPPHLLRSAARRLLVVETRSRTLGFRCAQGATRDEGH